MGAGAFLVVGLAIFGISRSRVNRDLADYGSAATGVLAPSPGSQTVPGPTRGGSTYAMPEAPVQTATAVAPRPAETAAGKRIDEGAAEQGEPSTDGETKAAAAAASPMKVRTVNPGSGPSGVEARKMLVEGEQMLRAQRFTEARDIFSKLTKTKGTRGRALVAMAEIAFQEKNYEETIRSATLAADRGGGARARVLLGDAHFRLSHFQDAATAYGQALRLDPENASAKAGLALASKRM